jgi:putative ABC transport system permease protein
MLVMVLTGVFDPPPSALAVPWVYLVLVAGLSSVAVAAVARWAVRASQRSPISVLRDL